MTVLKNHVNGYAAKTIRISMTIANPAWIKRMRTKHQQPK